MQKQKTRKLKYQISISDERGIIEKVFLNVAANQAAHYGRERPFVIRRLYVPSPLAGCDVENYLTD